MIPNIVLLKRPMSKKDQRKIRNYLLNEASPDIREHYKRMHELFDTIAKLLKETRKLIYLMYAPISTKKGQLALEKSH